MFTASYRLRHGIQSFVLVSHATVFNTVSKAFVINGLLTVFNFRKERPGDSKPPALLQRTDSKAGSA